MSSQITSNVFMIEPVCFEYNKQTAKNNAFQKEGFEIGAQEKAFIELNNFSTFSLSSPSNTEL